MFQSSVDLIRRLQTRRRSKVHGLILPLKEAVTTPHSTTLRAGYCATSPWYEKGIPLKGEVSNQELVFDEFMNQGGGD
jgi:hypothetical protein